MLCIENSDQLSFRTSENHEQCKTLFCPVPPIKSTNSPETVRAFYFSGLYALDSRAVYGLSILPGLKPAFSAGQYFRKVDDVGSSVKVVAVSISDDVRVKRAPLAFLLRTLADARRLACPFLGSKRCKSCSTPFCGAMRMTCCSSYGQTGTGAGLDP